MRRIRKTITKVCEQCHGKYTIPSHRIKQKYCSHSCATTNISQRRPLYAERIHVKKAERLPDPNQGNLSLLDPDEVEDLDSIIQVVKSTRRDWLTHQS